MASSDEHCCGPFDLIERIGRSASGETWRARNRQDDEPVAVKILPGELGPRRPPSLHRRLQSHAQLTHQTVALVRGYGTVESSELTDASGQSVEGVPYLAREFSEAGTLADRSLPSDWRTCRGLLLTLLDALAYSHAREVLHLNLKRENILCFPEETGLQRWKLADFGLGRDRPSSADGSRTAPAGAGYTAPEQRDGAWRRFGPWTDLYQIGCLARELVTGEALDGQPADVSSLDSRFAVPDGLTDWLKRLTADSPSERFRRAADATRRLTELTLEDGLADDELANPQSTRMEDRRDALLHRDGTARTLRELYEDRATPSESTADVSSADDADETGLDLPTTWRRSARRDPAPRTGEPPHELLPLRDTELAGRIPERDMIWSLLRRAAEDESTSGLVLEGQPGVGCSRLARWASRQAHETGAFQTLRARHGTRYGPGGGLTGLLRDWLRPEGLSREECMRHAEAKLAAHPPPGGPDPDRRQELAAGLTELLHPTSVTGGSSDGPAYHLGSEEERFALFHRLLTRLSRRRPVLLWLDDLHFGPQTLSFVEFLFDHLHSPSVFVLATTAAEPPSGARETHERLGRLTERPTIDDLTIRPLSEAKQRQLVDHILPLDDDSRERLQTQTEGRPLLPEHLLYGKAANGELERSGDGWRFTDDSAAALPTTLEELWRRRVDSAVETSPISSRADAHRALRLAALLGQYILADEWRAVCEADDIPFPDELVDAMVRRGLLERDRRGWRFPHRTLVDSLRQRAADAGRLDELHRLCADTLGDDQLASRRDLPRRRAHHWVRGDRPERALEPLLEAARRARESRGQPELAARLLEQRRDLLQNYQFDNQTRKRARQWIEEGWVGLNLGETSRAEGLADRARTLAESEDWPTIRAEASLLEARLANDAGYLSAAADHLDRAEELFEELDDRQFLGRCLSVRGHLARRQQAFDDAVEYFEQARDHFEAVGDAGGSLRCAWSLGRAQLGRGDSELARETAHDLLDRAEQLQHRPMQASACNLLGDIARTHERWDDAISFYDRTRRIWSDASPKQAAVPELNLALAHIAIRDWQAATVHLEDLSEKLPELGWNVFLAHVHLGLAVCSAAAENWDRFDIRVDSAESMLDTFEARDRDHARLAERAADLCLEADRPDHAADMFRLARRLWEALDADEDVERVEARLDDLPTESSEMSG
jgi:serine/threonine protein kinase/tetratricopeptide (TPR) repeat protein